MMQHLRLNGRQIEQCCALPVGQNAASWHDGLSRERCPQGVPSADIFCNGWQSQKNHTAEHIV